MKPGKLMIEVAAVIDAPVDRTWTLVRAGLSPTEENGTAAAHEGGWWYRGEWSAERDGSGTLVIHRVYNVAQSMRWGVPLANRFFVGFGESTRNEFERLILAVARQLGTTASRVEIRRPAR